MLDSEPTDITRLLESKITDGFSEEYLEIYAGRNGAGDAPHRYRVYVKGRSHENPLLDIHLQHGNPKHVGVNGIGTETMLNIIHDFLSCCQAGPFASPETGEVLAHIEAAQRAVRKRESDRKARGVYQTHQK